MCGRYILLSKAQKLANRFRLDQPPPLTARYNIAPTQGVAVVRQREDGVRLLAMMHWGLIPFWAKDADIGNRLINARSETVMEKPAFKQAFKKRRCLILADGFYEWRKCERGKQPYLFRMADEQPFAFAGLWERWDDPDGEAIESCTILTTQANDLVKSVHHRMPVILDRPDESRWLDEQAAAPRDLLQSFPAEQMISMPVSTHVNNPQHEDARCLQTMELF